MRLFWRTYCLNCGLHLKGFFWKNTDPNIAGQARTVCPRCNTLHEKYNTLDESGFGRKLEIIE